MCVISCCSTDRGPAARISLLPSARAKANAMDRRHSDTSWSSRRRRDDVEKRDARERDGEFEGMEAFVSKKKRQLGDLKQEAERLRSEKNRLRADLARKCSAVALLEAQLKDANAKAITRCKTILDEAFADVFDAPALGNTNGSAAKDDGSEEDSDSSEHGVGGDTDAAAGAPGASATQAASTPAAPLPLAWPGDAAPAPDERQEAPCEPAVPGPDNICETAHGGQ